MRHLRRRKKYPYTLKSISEHTKNAINQLSNEPGRPMDQPTNYTNRTNQSTNRSTIQVDQIDRPTNKKATEGGPAGAFRFAQRPATRLTNEPTKTTTEPYNQPANNILRASSRAHVGSHASFGSRLDHHPTNNQPTTTDLHPPIPVAQKKRAALLLYLQPSCTCGMNTSGLLNRSSSWWAGTITTGFHPTRKEPLIFSHRAS